jgi:predicted porin
LQAADFKGEAERTKVRLGIDYALSKSTSFNASFGWYKKGTPVRPGSSNILGTGLAQASNVSTNETQIMLMKRF